MLQTTEIDLTSRSGAAIAGLPTWPTAAYPYEAQLAAVMPEAMIAYVQAGRSDLRGTTSPLRERDACDLSRVWTAQNDSLPTRAVASDVLAGLPRWVGSAAVGSDVGFFADLGTPLTDYTIACLARVTTGSRNNGLVNVGETGTDRLLVYTSNTDKLSVQHGSTDAHAASASITVGAWMPIVASFVGSTKALRVYCGSTTPVISATTTNGAPASSLASLMISREGTLELEGELVFAAIWNTAVHTDADALSSLIAAMNGLAAL